MAKARGLTLLLDITQLHFDSTIPRSCKVCHLGPFPKSGGSSATRISTGLLGSSVHASSPIRFYVYAYFLIASGSEAGRPIGEMACVRVKAKGRPSPVDILVADDPPDMLVSAGTREPARPITERVAHHLGGGGGGGCRNCGPLLHPADHSAPLRGVCTSLPGTFKVAPISLTADAPAVQAFGWATVRT